MVLGEQQSKELRSTLIKIIQSKNGSIRDKPLDESPIEYRGSDGAESIGPGANDNMIIAGRQCSAKKVIEESSRAIEKIDEGTYGICDECEEEIPLKRLTLIPHSVLCVRCKEEEEKAEKRLPKIKNNGPRSFINYSVNVGNA